MNSFFKRLRLEREAMTKDELLAEANEKIKELYLRLGEIQSFAMEISTGGYRSHGGGNVDRDYVSKRLRTLCYGRGHKIKKKEQDNE
jgi:hypothetical protein